MSNMMGSAKFTASLLRTSASGFAGLAVSRTAERCGEDGELGGGFDAWQASFRSLVLELAAAVDDGGRKQFAERVAWTRDSFTARNLETEPLRVGLEELSAVLEESLPAAAWTPLPVFFEAAARELDQEQTARKVASLGVGPLDELVIGYLASLRAANGSEAVALVVDAIRAGRVSIDDALSGVLTPAMRAIGQLWLEGAISIAEEHFASQTTSRLLEQIVLLAPTKSANGRTVLLTMVEGDAHELGLRIVAAFFEIDGWRAICLGANIPSGDLPSAAKDFDADLIVLGATLNIHRDAVARATELLKRARPDLPVLVGGPAFAGLEERAKEIGANGCALAPGEALRIGRELVQL
jgi:methanogenic corrinoid protein MtbC1